MVLCYIEDNDAAKRFYKQFGFVETGRDEKRCIFEGIHGTQKTCGRKVLLKALSDEYIKYKKKVCRYLGRKLRKSGRLKSIVTFESPCLGFVLLIGF